jgi:hypothetical protein
MKLRPFMSHFNSPRDQISTPRVTKTAVNTQKRLNILSKPKNPHSHCTMHSPTQPMDQSTFNPTQSRLSPLGNNATVRSHTCSKSKMHLPSKDSPFLIYSWGQSISPKRQTAAGYITVEKKTVIPTLPLLEGKRLRDGSSNRNLKTQMASFEGKSMKHNQIEVLRNIYSVVNN